jgi:Family of unknown function (DUF6152)
MKIHSVEERRMRNRLAIVFALAVGFLVSLPLSAHHGAASILSGETVTLKGTVKAWLWSNPHCLLTLDVTGDDGKVVQWVVETQAPNSIYSSGYRKDSFKPGDTVTVVVEPVKTGRPNGRIAQATLADGTVLGSLPGEGGRRGGRGAGGE